LDIASSVVDFVGPCVGFAVIFQFLAIRFIPAFSDFLNGLHGSGGFMEGCSKHVGAPSDIGYMVVAKFCQLNNDAFSLAVIHPTVEQTCIYLLKKYPGVHCSILIEFHV
jgi:hypothetical protein